MYKQYEGNVWLSRDGDCFKCGGLAVAEQDDDAQPAVTASLAVAPRPSNLPALQSKCAAAFSSGTDMPMYRYSCKFQSMFDAGDSSLRRKSKHIKRYNLVWFPAQPETDSEGPIKSVLAALSSSGTGGGGGGVDVKVQVLYDMFNPLAFRLPHTVQSWGRLVFSTPRNHHDHPNYIRSMSEFEALAQTPPGGQTPLFPELERPWRGDAAASPLEFRYSPFDSIYAAGTAKLCVVSFALASLHFCFFHRCLFVARLLGG